MQFADPNFCQNDYQGNHTNEKINNVKVTNPKIPYS